jgi:DNA primase
MRRDHDDARRIREALNDPHALCSALGLIEGSEGYGKGCNWRRIVGGVQVCCPWHNERTPSCAVTRGADSTVRVKCFGCSEGGDALSLVAVVHRLDVRRDFGAVLEVAADIANVARPSKNPSGAHPPPRRPAPGPARPPAVEVPDDGVMEQIAAVLRERAPVTRSPAAMEYLRGRSLAHGPALGWFALPVEARELAALRVAVIEAVGADGWMRSGFAHGPDGAQWRRAWLGRLVIPWEAPNGAVMSFQGRAIGEPREGEPKYTVPMGRPMLWPWGCADLNELAGADTAVAFVEGAVDAHSFNALALAHGADVLALGLPGADGWRDSWARFARGRVAVVALDDDAAGARHVGAIRAALVREARAVEVRTPAAGKDWNDTLRAMRAQRATG